MALREEDHRNSYEMLRVIQR